MTPRCMAKMGLPFIEIWKSARRAALGKKTKRAQGWTHNVQNAKVILFCSRIHFVNVPVSIRKS